MPSQPVLSVNGPVPGVSPGRRRICAAILLAVTVVWAAVMVASLRWRFLDRLLAPTDVFGSDFFQAPRAFCNLLAGNSIFLTEIGDYGPYATVFFNHPFLALAVGPWTAPLSPWAAFGAFECLSVGLLLLGAWRLAKAFDDPLGKAFSYFAMFCCWPVYMVLWNGQMEIFVVLALALIFAGLMGLEKEGQNEARGGAEERGRGGGTADAVILSAAKNLGQTATSARFFAALRMTTHARFSPSAPLPVSPSSSAHRWIQLGLLISLLSKPVVALLLPVLFFLPETRRKLLLPVAVYATVSLLLLLVPRLNPGHYNGIHWLYVPKAATSTKVVAALVEPTEVDLSKTLAMHSLPLLLSALGVGKAAWALARLPVAAVALMSLVPLVLSGRGPRIRATIVVAALCVLAHNLSYLQGWDYHYIALAPLLPVTLWLWRRESVPGLRRLLMVAFLTSLTLILPIPLFFPRDNLHWWIAKTLLRATPVLVAFVSLLIYGAAAAWRGRRRPRLIAPRTGHGLRAALCLGGAMGVLLAAVGVTAYATVPERLRVAAAKWTPRVWQTHLEDILSRPGIAPEPEERLHQLLGQWYAPTEPDVALQHLRQAAAFPWHSARTRTNLGSVFFALGRFDDAIEQSQKALELDPYLAEAHDNLAAALAKRGRKDEALDHFRRAIELNPRLADAYKNFGAALAGWGRLDEAIARYRQALDVQPNYAEAHNNLGAALAGGGRLEEAMEHYRRALDAKPGYAEAHYNLGLALAGCGRREEAIEHYRQALELKPDYALALNELAWLRATSPEAALRDGAAAVELAQRANRLTGGQRPEMLGTLAAAYAEAGMFSQAIETVSQALDLARQQNNAPLVEKLKGRLLLYDVGTPCRETLQP